MKIVTVAVVSTYSEFFMDKVDKYFQHDHINDKDVDQEVLSSEIFADGIVDILIGASPEHLDQIGPVTDPARICVEKMLKEAKEKGAQILRIKSEVEWAPSDYLVGDKVITTEDQIINSNEIPEFSFGEVVQKSGSDYDDSGVSDEDWEPTTKVLFENGVCVLVPDGNLNIAPDWEPLYISA